jgi:hypothetical protein
MLANCSLVLQNTRLVCKEIPSCFQNGFHASLLAAKTKFDDLWQQKLPLTRVAPKAPRPF